MLSETQNRRHSGIPSFFRCVYEKIPSCECGRCLRFIASCCVFRTLNACNQFRKLVFGCRMPPMPSPRHGETLSQGWPLLTKIKINVIEREHGPKTRHKLREIDRHRALNFPLPYLSLLEYSPSFSVALSLPQSFPVYMKYVSRFYLLSTRS